MTSTFARSYEHLLIESAVHKYFNKHKLWLPKILGVIKDLKQMIILINLVVWQHFDVTI